MLIWPKWCLEPKCHEAGTWRLRKMWTDKHTLTHKIHILSAGCGFRCSLAFRHFLTYLSLKIMKPSMSSREWALSMLASCVDFHLQTSVTISSILIASKPTQKINIWYSIFLLLKLSNVSYHFLTNNKNTCHHRKKLQYPTSYKKNVLQTIHHKTLH